LRETQNPLRSNRLRFFFRKRLLAQGFSTGKVPTSHPPLHFPLLQDKRGTEGEFGVKGPENHIKANLFSRLLRGLIPLFYHILRSCPLRISGNCHSKAFLFTPHHGTGGCPPSSNHDR